MNDTERLDWLEKTEMSLISDDSGSWAVTSDGMQSCSKNPPDDTSTAFFIEEHQWRKNVREAIETAKEENDS